MCFEKPGDTRHRPRPPAALRACSRHQPHFLISSRVWGWRFYGTYLPKEVPGTDQLEMAKAHTSCVTCVECRKPVLVDHWAEGPRHRRYHLRCWEGVCTDLCAAPDRIPGWCAARAPTDLELAYLLQNAIREGSDAAIHALLHARPELDLFPLPGAPSARHTAAAAAGRLGQLRMLLERRPGALDVPDPMDAMQTSLYIGNMDQRRNDLYVLQPHLRYNAKPVYVGQTYGQYIYYYIPQSKQKALAKGWCLSDYLGNGALDFRLKLPEEEAVEDARSSTSEEGRDAAGNPDAPPPRRGRWWHLKKNPRPQSPRATDKGTEQMNIQQKTLNNIVTAFTKKKKPQEEEDDDDDCWPEAGPTITVDPVTAVAEPAENPFAEGAAVGADPAASPAVNIRDPEEIGLQEVPQTVSLLQCAARSGDPAIVRHVCQLYRERFPQCLRWQHEIGHGLWFQYSNTIQRSATDGLRQGMGSITVDYEHKVRRLLLSL